MIHENIQDFLLKDARERFLRYVRIDTASDPDSGKHPSTEKQRDLARLLEKELHQIGLVDIELDEFCYVYATLSASDGVDAPPVTLCAHMDTSSSEPGKDVRPVIHENYDGGVISFEDDPDLALDPGSAPELLKYKGENIITASGKTLLGADDKAGIAEIMAALAALKRFEGLPHPELRVIFTPDEEIGEGSENINTDRFGEFGYTIDGGEMGEIEAECFDAHEAELVFHGKNIHPGYAKNKMINAGAIAARFFSALPEYGTPERTEKREGFYHLLKINGDETRAMLKMIIRDFERENNLKRIKLLEQLITTYELLYPGLKIDLHLKDQYRNMREVIEKHPAVIEKACKAVEMAGLPVIRKPIRGGTDGARFCFMGMPTPNIFTGGHMFHSKTEWIPENALPKASEVILHLCRAWADGSRPWNENREV